MDLKLRIFKTAYEELNFSETAKLLNMSQPGVSRHIKQLEEFYGAKLFSRNNGKLEPTVNAKYLYEKCILILNEFEGLEKHFKTLNQAIPDQLVIGCSTTIAVTLFPDLALKLRKENPSLYLSMISGNTKRIEELLMDKKLDFALTEGQSNNKLLAYEHFADDELVLVRKARNEVAKTIEIDKLKELQIIRREYGSGTRQVIDSTLYKNGIDLRKSLLNIGNTQAIKTLLKRDANLYAFLSIHSVSNDLKAQELEIIDIKDLSILRPFYFISRQGEHSYAFNWFKNQARWSLGPTFVSS